MEEIPQAAEKTLPNVRLTAQSSYEGSSGTGGWAFVLSSGKREKIGQGSAPNTTSNRMELLTIIMGLNALKTPSTVTITSPSTYLSHGLTQWIEKWNLSTQTNGDLWAKLLDAAQPHQLILETGDGHKEDQQRVTRLALQARNEQIEPEEDQDQTGKVFPMRGGQITLIEMGLPRTLQSAPPLQATISAAPDSVSPSGAQSASTEQTTPTNTAASEGEKDEESDQSQQETQEETQVNPTANTVITVDTSQEVTGDGTTHHPVLNTRTAGITETVPEFEPNKRSPQHQVSEPETTPSEKEEIDHDKIAGDRFQDALTNMRQQIKTNPYLVGNTKLLMIGAEENAEDPTPYVESMMMTLLSLQQVTLNNATDHEYSVALEKMTTFMQAIPSEEYDVSSAQTSYSEKGHRITSVTLPEEDELRIITLRDTLHGEIGVRSIIGLTPGQPRLVTLHLQPT